MIKIIKIKNAIFFGIMTYCSHKSSDSGPAPELSTEQGMFWEQKSESDSCDLASYGHASNESQLGLPEHLSLFDDFLHNPQTYLNHYPDLDYITRVTHVDSHSGSDLNYIYFVCFVKEVFNVFVNGFYANIGSDRVISYTAQLTQNSQGSTNDGECEGLDYNYTIYTWVYLNDYSHIDLVIDFNKDKISFFFERRINVVNIWYDFKNQKYYSIKVRSIKSPHTVLCNKMSSTMSLFDLLKDCFMLNKTAKNWFIKMKRDVRTEKSWYFLLLEIVDSIDTVPFIVLNIMLNGANFKEYFYNSHDVPKRKMVYFALYILGGWLIKHYDPIVKVSVPNMYSRKITRSNPHETISFCCMDDFIVFFSQHSISKYICKDGLIYKSQCVRLPRASAVVYSEVSECVPLHAPLLWYSEFILHLI